jgi:predicted lipoprotein with Yx(FWY)xxD motif
MGYRLLAVAVVGAALACAAGCGRATANRPATVGVRAVAGKGDVLVDPAGRTLYTAAEEVGGTVLCTGACAQVWLPLTVPAGTVPVGGDGVGGALGTVPRPDGGTQVTYDGHPLYTFTRDAAAGQAGGDGQADDVAGVTLHWRVAQPDAATQAPPAPGGGGY